MRKSLLLLCTLLSFSVFVGAATPAPDRPVMVIVHGAWGGGWQFKKIQPLLEQNGFQVYRPTLTGLGERSHLSRVDIGLETHIEDIVNLIRFENLHDVILIGHSYGGMVVTGVADRLPDRIKCLIYLDAFIPEDGESVQSLWKPGGLPIERMTKDGFIIPSWVKPDKPYPMDVPHPVKTFTDALSLKNPAAREIPAAYVLTVDKGQTAEEDDFYPAFQRAKARGWPVRQMEANHNPQWFLPAETAALLTELAKP